LGSIVRFGSRPLDGADTTGCRRPLDGADTTGSRGPRPGSAAGLPAEAARRVSAIATLAEPCGRTVALGVEGSTVGGGAESRRSALALPGTSKGDVVEYASLAASAEGARFGPGRATIAPTAAPAPTRTAAT
jgi:hypothetical protein